MRREASSVHMKEWDGEEPYRHNDKITSLAFAKKVENLETERRQFGLSSSKEKE